MKDPTIEDLDVTFGDAPDTKESDADVFIQDPHDHQFCHPRIAVGSGVWSSNDVKSIKASGITHVIDCRSTAAAEKLYDGTDIKFMHCPTDDDNQAKSADWFRKGVSWALEALATPGNIILVHCAAGMNRGPSMAYAILRAIDYDPKRAFQAIKRARRVATMRYKLYADKFISQEYRK